MAKKQSLGDKLQKTIHNAAENIQDAAEAVKTKADEAEIVEKVKDIFDKDEEKETKDVPETIDGAKVLSTDSALRIIYYLMAVDGEIFHSEEEKFDSIGKELDPEFTINKEKIVKISPDVPRRIHGHKQVELIPIRERREDMRQHTFLDLFSSAQLL